MMSVFPPGQPDRKEASAAHTKNLNRSSKLMEPPLVQASMDDVSEIP
jgi:hypothetical protein